MKNGDFWDQTRVAEGRRPGPAGWSREAAKRMVSSGFAPSMIVSGGKIMEPKDMDKI